MRDSRTGLAPLGPAPGAAGQNLPGRLAPGAKRPCPATPLHGWGTSGVDARTVGARKAALGQGRREERALPGCGRGLALPGALRGSLPSPCPGRLLLATPRGQCQSRHLQALLPRSCLAVCGGGAVPSAGQAVRKRLPTEQITTSPRDTDRSRAETPSTLGGHLRVTTAGVRVIPRAACRGLATCWSHRPGEWGPRGQDTHPQHPDTPTATATKPHRPHQRSANAGRCLE